MNMSKTAKVNGIGGIFFKCDETEKMKAWYRAHLGIITNEYGALFEFKKAAKSDESAFLQWSPFSKDSNYFEPSNKEFMINYRVNNIEALVAELKASGVTILDEIETFEYGRFVHILDPENNKIELWEAVDSCFTALYKNETNKEG
jgi:predicted enzyme related to lactoylglutathione lyase